MAGAVADSKTDSAAQQQIFLRAALQHFADGAYAATSVQQIIGIVKVSKPALYYHFRDKAGLFQVLVYEANDECCRLNPSAFRRMGLMFGSSLKLI